MENTSSHYYDIVCKVSSFTGMWPYLKPATRILRVALLTLIALTLIVPQIAYQFMCKTDVYCTFKAMTSYLLTIVILLKVYTFQFYNRTIKDLTQHLFVDWERLRTQKEYEIMRSYAENSRRFSLIYSVYCMLAVCMFMSISLVPILLDIVSPLPGANKSRPISPPYPGYYFVDYRDYFIEIFWHSVVSWQILVTGIIGHDSMFVTYVEHVCGIFATIGFHLERLFYDRNEAARIVNVRFDSNDVYRKRIASLVHTHREAIRFAQILEDTFTVPFAVQMLIVTIGISITLLQITQQDSDVLEKIKYVLYINSQLIHLFLLSFEGQKLIDHSLELRDKIYNSSWYEVPMRSQRLIILVMMKSLRPSFFSAGRIYVFSLESFATVLQTSMSYFTVLASFR